MVNANKHRALKILNELTAPERIIRQEINRAKRYNKNKYKVSSECNFKKERFDNLENKYGRLRGV